MVRVVHKTSSGGGSEQECRLNHPLPSGSLTKHKLRAELLSPQDKGKRMFNLQKECFFALVSHCHSSHLSTCNLCCLSTCVTTGRLGGWGVHCYHCTVSRCVSSLESGKVQLHLLEGSVVAAQDSHPFFKFCCDLIYIHKCIVFVGKKTFFLEWRKDFCIFDSHINSWIQSPL